MAPKSNNFNSQLRLFGRTLRWVSGQMRGFKRVNISFMLRVSCCALSVTSFELRTFIALCAVHNVFYLQILNSEICPLSVCIRRQVKKHPFERCVRYISLALKIGRGAAGNQLPFVDDTDTLTDVLGHCQGVG